MLMDETIYGYRKVRYPSLLSEAAGQMCSHGSRPKCEDDINLFSTSSLVYPDVCQVAIFHTYTQYWNMKTRRVQVDE